MSAVDAIQELTDKAILFTVLIECEAGIAGASWHVVLSDNHARKGMGRGQSLGKASHEAIADLNAKCGGQLRSYL